MTNYQIISNKIADDKKMVSIYTLIDKYGANEFEIDCHDIEVHEFEEKGPLIFKGPGLIRSGKNGQIRFKLYNQIPFGAEKIPIINRISPTEHDNPLIGILIAHDYNGIKWIGGVTIPEFDFSQLVQSQNFTAHGKFDQLSTRVKKTEGDRSHDLTELVFVGRLGLPYSGTFRISTYRGSEEISKSWGKGFHELDHKNSKIVFDESPNGTSTRVKIYHREGFSPPHVESWVPEALRFIIAKPIYPRMVIRHFKNDSLVFIRETPTDSSSGIPSPFQGEFTIEKDAWDGFLTYLSMCESEGWSDYLEISKGFSELLAASTGTIQGLLISLAWYIESVVIQIYSNKKQRTKEKAISEEELSDLINYVERWDYYNKIKSRTRGLLSMLRTPDVQYFLRDLVKQHVIEEVHKKVWNKVRHKVMHGGLADFSKSNDFWHYANYLISMAHRVTLRLIKYQGRVLDYNGNKFNLADFKWRTLEGNKAEEKSIESET